MDSDPEEMSLFTKLQIFFFYLDSAYEILIYTHDMCIIANIKEV